MKFTCNDWCQHDIIKKIKILTKWGAGKIYNFLPMKYQKYSSIITIKHTNVLDQVNKPSYKCLLDMTP